MVYVVLVVVLILILLMLWGVTSAFEGLSEHEWLKGVAMFFVAGTFNLAFVAALGVGVFWIPYFVLYQLSPKEFWIEDGRLCHRVRLFGLIRRTRRIEFGRILDIEISPSGSVFHLVAVYRMRLPRFVRIIVVYWNERWATWPLTLVSALPTREGAEQIQRRLLEAITRPGGEGCVG